MHSLARYSRDFARQPILQQDLGSWTHRPIEERTWANMVQHFRDAKSNLGALPTAGEFFHEANAATAIAD